MKVEEKHDNSAHATAIKTYTTILELASATDPAARASGDYCQDAGRFRRLR